jgi:hypothetical protein
LCSGGPGQRLPDVTAGGRRARCTTHPAQATCCVQLSPPAPPSAWRCAGLWGSRRHGRQQEHAAVAAVAGAAAAAPAAVAAALAPLAPAAAAAARRAACCCASSRQREQHKGRCPAAPGAPCSCPKLAAPPCLPTRRPRDRRPRRRWRAAPSSAMRLWWASSWRPWTSRWWRAAAVGRGRRANGGGGLRPRGGAGGQMVVEGSGRGAGPGPGRRGSTEVGVPAACSRPRLCRQAQARVAGAGAPWAALSPRSLLAGRSAPGASSSTASRAP